MGTPAGTHHTVVRQAAAGAAGKLRRKGKQNCNVTLACDVGSMRYIGQNMCDGLKFRPAKRLTLGRSHGHYMYRQQMKIPVVNRNGSLCRRRCVCLVLLGRFAGQGDSRPSFTVGNELRARTPFSSKPSKSATNVLRNMERAGQGFADRGSCPKGPVLATKKRGIPRRPRSGSPMAQRAPGRPWRPWEALGSGSRNPAGG